MNFYSFITSILVVTGFQVITEGSPTNKSQLQEVIRDELINRLKDEDEGMEKPIIPENKIIGGWSASSGMIGYQTYVTGITLNMNTQQCGGSLISRKHVLTAAHCLVRTVGSLVVLGSSNKNNMFGPGVISAFVEPSNYVLHPDYDDIILINDIAILRLPNKITLSFTISTISLPTASMTTKDYFAGMTGLISGFGKTHDDAYTGSDKLQMAYAEIITLKKCQPYFNRLISLRDSHICTSFNGTGTCNGDSGGPLVVEIDRKQYLVGITSFGGRFCESPIPSVYTNVASYINWIQNVVSLN